MTQCDFYIYLYIGDLSHDRYQSFPREVMCVLTVHLLYSFPYLHDAPSLISLPIHSYHVVRSSLLHDLPIVTCLLDDLVRCVEREVRLPDVLHYPATAYSGPMIRWRFLAAADVRRALFSSPSVDRPMCAKQHHT